MARRRPRRRDATVTAVLDPVDPGRTDEIDESVERTPVPRRGLLRSGWTKGGGLVVAAVVLFAVAVCSLAIGAKSIPFGDVVDAVFNFDPTNGDQQIIRSYRIPRTFMGLAVGSALAMAGVAMQGVTRNPLADTGIFGVNGGASLAVVVATTVFSVTSASTYVWFAFLGAAIASLVVYALGSVGRGGATPVKLALAGAALAAMLQAFTAGVLLLDIQALEKYRFWAVGALTRTDGAEILMQVAPFLVIGYVIAFLAAPGLNALALGDDMARALGQRVQVARAMGALAVVICAGAAVAAAGPIAFVGLTIPHVARLLCGPDYRWIMPWSMVLAPVLLLGADIIGRVIARPGELQVGIVVALVGAPIFMILVRRQKLAAL